MLLENMAALIPGSFPIARLTTETADAIVESAGFLAEQRRAVKEYILGATIAIPKERCTREPGIHNRARCGVWIPDLPLRGNPE